MTPQDTIVQIRSIIQRLIAAGLSNQQKYPVWTPLGNKEVEIGIAGAPDLSASMKDIPYTEVYSRLEKEGAFHIRMIDGALVQMCYRFRRNRIVAHRLCVFPAPHLELFDTAPDLYENDEIYADIMAKSIVHVPIRFDFDADTTKHLDVRHPMSHLTLGHYPNCRIPVTAPLTPARFAKFILRNFYGVAFAAARLETIDSTFAYGDTITRAEREIAHLRP